MRKFLICLFKRWKRSTAEDWENLGNKLVMISSFLAGWQIASSHPFAAGAVAVLGSTAKILDFICKLMAQIKKDKEGKKK